MQRLVPLLAPAGLLLILGAWVWQATQGPLPGRLGPWVAASLALVVLHLILRWEDATRVVGTRQAKYGVNSVVFSLLFLAILVLGNYAVQKNTVPEDLTKNKRYSLSPQTLKLLGGLQDDVTITYFEQTKAKLMAAQDSMRAYEFASPHVKLELVDARENAQKARENDVKLVPTLVLRRGARQETINSDREQDVATALVKLTREGKKTVCFVEGEGEARVDDTSERGLQRGKQAIEQKQYATKKIVLLRDGQVPADCTLVVLAAPQKDLRPEAIAGLREYVKAGGKLLALLEPEFKEPQPNLTALLAEWNIVVGQDLVLDLLASRKLGGRVGAETLVTTLAPHEEPTKDLASFAVLFQTARSVEAGTAMIEGVHASKLAWVEASAFKQKDLSEKALASLPFEQLMGKLTTVDVAALATIQAPTPRPAPVPSPGASPAPEQTRPPEGRVIVFGDSDFVTNGVFEWPGSSDLLLNSVAWLAQDSDLISIQPRDPDDQRLALNGGQTILMRIFALLALPGLFVVLGIATWWRRRG